MLGAIHTLGLQTARSQLGNAQQRPEPSAWLPQLRRGVSVYSFGPKDGTDYNNSLFPDL